MFRVVTSSQKSPMEEAEEGMDVVLSGGSSISRDGADFFVEIGYGIRPRAVVDFQIDAAYSWRPLHWKPFGLVFGPVTASVIQMVLGENVVQILHASRGIYIDVLDEQAGT